MHSGNHLRTTICEHFYGKVGIDTYLSVHQKQENDVLTIDRWHFLFLMWNEREEELLSFIEDLNKMHPSIKFHLKYSKTEIEFLDTKIYKHTNGKLCLTINRKPTDRQNYLHFKSVHPPSLKKTIPHSQVLCISKICTETNEMTKHLAQLKEAFL